MAPHPKEYVFYISWLLLVEWYLMVGYLIFFKFVILSGLTLFSFFVTCRQSFASASADNVKKFNLPKGEFVHNMLWVHKLLPNLCD